MNDIVSAKALGWFSIGLGITELVMGRRLNRMLGLGQTPGLVRAFGAREIAAGTAVLAYPDTAVPMWMRVAGDVLDIAVLLGAVRNARDKEPALLALAAVVGVTVADVATASALTRRHTRALATARRTRVR